MSTRTNTVRMQFEISEALAKEIESFEAEAEITSHREFFGNLIAFWRWAAKRSQEGKSICALDMQTLKYNELTLPSLDLIKMKALAERELEMADLRVRDEREGLQSEGLTPSQA